MTKNPFLNAISALVYIAMVASIMFYGEKIVPNVEETVILPIAFLSLFVLSAAVMAYIFLFKPVQLYLDGEKKLAASLFLKTLATFAVITIVIFSLIAVLN